MTFPNVRPNIKLSKLRDIGWEYWDPIGLAQHDGLNEVKENCDDEYDSYLMQAAGMIWHNKLQKEIIAYLIDIEQNYIGMPDRGSEAATQTVGKIHEYLNNLETAAR